jgi:hypothetical protein
MFVVVSKHADVNSMAKPTLGRPHLNTHTTINKFKPCKKRRFSNTGMVQLATRSKDQAKLTPGLFRKPKTKQIAYHEKLHLLETRGYQQLQGTGIVLMPR